MKKLILSLTFVLLICALAFTLSGCSLVAHFMGYGESHTHQYDEEITKAPSCSEEGVKTFKCSCNDSYTEAIEKLPHTEEAIPAVDPTCTEAGLTEGKKCSVCEEIIVAQEEIAALGHTEQVVAGSAATCTEKGLTEGKKCSVCDEILVAQEEIAALGHTEQVVAGKAASCTEAGLTDGKKCSACGETLVAQEEIAALGHTEEVVPGKAATCTEAGLTDGKKCSTCGETLVAQENIKALGHKDGNNDFKCDACGEDLCTEHAAGDAKEENRVDATCTTEGSYDLVVKCSVCGEELSRDHKVIPVIAHTEETVAGKAATCTESGLTDGKKCSVCGETLVAQEEIKALGHTEETVPGKAATCTEAGLTDGKKCSVCKITLKEQTEISPTGHAYAGVVTTAPGCTTEGVETFTCANCSDSYTEVLASLGHSYDNESDYVCNNCGFDRTAEYRLENGGFENGLEGWTVVGNIGGVSSDKSYWVNDPESAEGFEFGMDGNNMFSAYAPGAFESSVGTLTSSSFKVGGSGFVTFKLGAMRDANYVYVDVVDASTKQILARYYNGLWAERTNDVKSGCTLIAYKADLSAFAGKEVFFRISDNADSGYGLFFADSFITYYENEPDGFNVATPVEYEIGGTIYDVFNGGFEMGNVQGWWNNGEIGVVTNATGYWGDNIPYDKVGEFLFTGVESNGADTMREGNRGSLTSSVFEVGGAGYISFKLGGGGNSLCYVQVIDAVTGEVLARYHQQAQQDAKLIQYAADLSAYIGRTVRIQVVDMAENNWGCVSFDNVVTYYPEGAALPEGITANDIKGDLKYTIDNGSFESGNIDGWTMNITEAGAHNTLGWVLETEIDAGWYTKNDGRKDGTYLFTFAQPGDINCENTKGNLQSSTFSLKSGSFVSFKFGGAGTRDVHVQLCREDGSVIATFYNEAPGKVNTEMYSYYYQYNGPEVNCFFKVVDNSTSNYGCFVVDDFRVNLESAPEGYIAAIQ